MKSPLRYQATDFDCSGVSLMNCLMYLFEREEMPAELVKVMSAAILDCYDSDGNLKEGSSSVLMKFVSRWVGVFAFDKGIPLACKYKSGQEVSPYDIAKCLKEGGCVNMRTYVQNKEHFVVLTAIDDNYVYLFDPYFKTAEAYKDNESVEYIGGHPFAFNRRVKVEQFLDVRPKEFSLGPVEKREIVLFMRDDSALTHQFG